MAARIDSNVATLQGSRLVLVNGDFRPGLLQEVFLGEVILGSPGGPTRVSGLVRFLSWVLLDGCSRRCTKIKSMGLKLKLSSGTFILIIIAMVMVVVSTAPMATTTIIIAIIIITITIIIIIIILILILILIIIIIIIILIIPIFRMDLYGPSCMVSLGLFRTWKNLKNICTGLSLEFLRFLGSFLIFLRFFLFNFVDVWWFLQIYCHRFSKNVWTMFGKVARDMERCRFHQVIFL